LAYSTVQCARVIDPSLLSVIPRMPYQSPLAGVAEDDVNTIGSSAVPTADSEPFTISSLRDALMPPP